MKKENSRRPTHPGEMLLLEFLEPYNLTQKQLADAIHVPYQRVNELVNQKRGITPSTAIRLSIYFGNTPEFWLNLQSKWDLYNSYQKEQKAFLKIVPQNA